MKLRHIYFLDNYKERQIYHKQFGWRPGVSGTGRPPGTQALPLNQVPHNAKISACHIFEGRRHTYAVGIHRTAALTAVSNATKLHRGRGTKSQVSYIPPPK